MIACFLMPHIAICTERIRQPELCSKPLALEAEGGVLHRVSDEAAQFGVRPGQKNSGAKALCPDLRLLPYEREVYEQAAALIWDALAVESSVVEPESPEVCYAEVDDCHVTPRIRKFAAYLAAKANTPVQVGLGCSKITARTAALNALPGEPVIVYPGCESSLLAAVDIETLCVTGLRMDAEMVRRMGKLGINTLGDVQMISFRNLHRAVGRMATRLARLAIGLDGDPVLPSWPLPSLTAVETFEYEVTNLEQLHEALRRGSRRLARSLQIRREYACRLILRLTGEDRRSSAQEERLPAPTQTPAHLCSAALRLLSRMQIEQALQTVNAVSMTAEDLTIPSGLQMELMDAHGNHLPADTLRRVQVTLDYLYSRFGAGAVLKGATLHRPRRIDFWIAPYCKQLSESVEVIENLQGRPVSFLWRRRLYQVRAVLNDWCETRWVWNEVVRTAVFRIETDPCGLFELKRLGSEWKLTAAQD